MNRHSTFFLAAAWAAGALALMLTTACGGRPPLPSPAALVEEPATESVIILTLTIEGKTVYQATNEGATWCRELEPSELEALGDDERTIEAVFGGDS